MKTKRRVESKYTTKAEYYEFYKGQGKDPEDYDIDDFNEVKISVGWPDLDKIILFGDGDYNKENIEWCEQVAKTVCDALNEKKL